MIPHMYMTENDIFVNLGSGVDQVVLQIAALNLCKMALGIELAESPSHYAEVRSILKILF